MPSQKWLAAFATISPMNLPRLKILSLLIGFPVFTCGAMLPLVPFWPWFFYFAGCFVALVGAYIISRSMDYDLTGIAFAIIGAPWFFLSMPANSFRFLASFGADEALIVIVRFVSCLLAALFLLAVFGDD